MAFQRAIFLCLATAIGVSAVGAQTLLVNGGFETQPNWNINGDGGYTLLTGAQMPGWTIESGHGVTVHIAGHYPSISGGYSVNVDGEGSNGHNANFYQDFSSIAGATYSLSFDWQGWYDVPGLKLEVSVVDFDPVTGGTRFDGVYVHDLSGLHNESATFTGTGNPLRLRIQEQTESGGNDNGFIVDNFSVTLTAIPEPGDAAIASGAIALAFAAWQRRRARAGRSLRNAD